MRPTPRSAKAVLQTANGEPRDSGRDSIPFVNAARPRGVPPRLRADQELLVTDDVARSERRQRQRREAVAEVMRDIDRLHIDPAKPGKATKLPPPVRN